MIDEKKAAQQRESRREILRDAVYLAGVVSLCTGVYLEFGTGWALIAFGVICIGVIFLPMVIRNAP